MPNRKLTSTDAFVVTDLEGAEVAAGVARLAPKILVDGATWLARSYTYQFALFEQRVSGASAGINAKGDARAAAVAAFTTELGPEAAAGRLVLEPGKGVGPDDLEPLTASSPVPPASPADAGALLAAGAVAAADAACGLSGRRVVVEGVDALSGAAAQHLIARLDAAGASVVGLSTAKASVGAAGGLDRSALDAALAGPPAELVDAVVAAGDGLTPGPAADLFGADADVIFAGSKAGVIDHDVAAAVSAGTVVPVGRLPVTAKALAALRRRGVTVLPDFLTLAGPWLAAGPAPLAGLDPVADPDAVGGPIRSVLEEVAGHDDGPLLAACYRAESFLATWQDDLPFGRPLA